MAKTKPKFIRDIEKYAKGLGVDILFVQCQKHVQIVANGILLTTVSNGNNTGRDDKLLRSKIRRCAEGTYEYG